MLAHISGSLIMMLQNERKIGVYSCGDKVLSFPKENFAKCIRLLDSSFHTDSQIKIIIFKFLIGSILVLEKAVLRYLHLCILKQLLQ